MSDKEYLYRARVVVRDDPCRPPTDIFEKTEGDAHGVTGFIAATIAPLLRRDEPVLLDVSVIPVVAE